MTTQAPPYMIYAIGENITLYCAKCEGLTVHIVLTSRGEAECTRPHVKDAA